MAHACMKRADMLYATLVFKPCVEDHTSVQRSEISVGHILGRHLGLTSVLVISLLFTHLNPLVSPIASVLI